MSSARSVRIVTMLAAIQFLSVAGQNAISSSEDFFSDLDTVAFMLHDHDHYFYLARGHGRSGCGTHHDFSPSAGPEPSGLAEHRDTSASNSLEGLFPAINTGVGMGAVAHNLGLPRRSPSVLEHQPISRLLNRRPPPVGPQLPLRPRPRLYTGRRSKILARHDHLYYQPTHSEGSQPRNRAGSL